MTAAPAPLPSATADAEHWIGLIETRLAEEQPFLAYDLCDRARAVWPGHPEIALLGVLAQLRGHSTGAAGKALEECRAAHPEPTSERARRWLAEIHRLLWEQSGRRAELERSRGLYLALYRSARRPEDGVLAAALCRYLGVAEEARAVALELAAQCAAPPPGEEPLARYRRLLRRGHAALLLERPAEALERYAEAAAGWRGDYRPVVAARKRLRALEALGIAVPPQVAELLRPPRILIFGGQPIDPPGMAEPILPPAKEASLRQAIEAQLDAVGARIGYSSAACGSDLLFAEALLARGGELHVVLPCARDDFVAARVGYAGERWRERFEAVLGRAATVSYATHERYLGHTALLRYTNEIITGLGWLRAALLFTEPHLLAVWDYRAGNAPGSPADFIDHWPDIKTLHLIELDELAAGEGEPHAPARPAWQQPQPPQREIRAMLFADVVGYSKLGEEYLPNFLTLLARVKELLDATGDTADLIEAWGDAFYIVMPTARRMLRYAFQLREAFRALDHRAYGLPAQLNVRIGLHAGPVFTGIHPVTGRAIYIGRQVNRAARIEPITLPGEVYASQELVALLTAEENAVKHELAFGGGRYRPWFRAEYMGIIEMPKRHGSQSIYHLLPAARPSAADGENPSA